jgi:hypothetical protein
MILQAFLSSSYLGQKSYGKFERPIKYMTNDTTSKTTNMKKITRAISAEAIAMPVNPSTPAMMETIRKIKTQRNIQVLHFS